MYISKVPWDGINLVTHLININALKISLFPTYIISKSSYLAFYTVKFTFFFLRVKFIFWIKKKKKASEWGPKLVNPISVSTWCRIIGGNSDRSFVVPIFPRLAKKTERVRKNASETQENRKQRAKKSSPLPFKI